MGSESFYGGRQGASFVIVKRFDGIDIPVYNPPEHDDYAKKNLAVTSGGEYYIYPFVEKTEDNKDDYTWKETELNGSVVVVWINETEILTDRHLPIEYSFNDPSTYKNKICAVNQENGLFLYDSSAAEGARFTEQTSDNYKDYAWGCLELNGRNLLVWDTASAEDDKTIVVSVTRAPAEGMVQCFKKGGDSTDIVNYGEYVLIDTYQNVHERNNPDHGKVFRRGMDYNYSEESNPLAGAEYIGQICGPQGESPEVDMDTVNNILATPGGRSGSYTSMDDIVPGMYVEDGVKKFHDSITYAWTTLRDQFGNVESAVIGFTFPYLVEEFQGRRRLPYYNAELDCVAVEPKGTENPKQLNWYEIIGGKYELTDDTIVNSSVAYFIIPGNGSIGKIAGEPLDEDFNLVTRLDSGLHPYYEKWNISLPQGIQGDSFQDFEICPYYAQKDVYIYSDPSLITTIGVTTGEERIDIEEYDREQSYIHLAEGGYISIDDYNRNFNGLRYKQYSYKENEKGKYQYKEVGLLPSIIDTQIHTASEESEDEGSGTQKLAITYSVKDGEVLKEEEIGQPINYIVDTKVVPMTDTEVDGSLKGHLLVYYSDPDRRKESTITAKSTRLGKVVTGWVDIGDASAFSKTPLTIGQYPTLEAIPNQPPENIMDNSKYSGWFAEIAPDPSGDNTVHLASWDYDKEQWNDVGPLVDMSGVTPNYFIALENDAASLKPLGFEIDTTIRKTVN